MRLGEVDEKLAGLDPVEAEVVALVKQGDRRAALGLLMRTYAHSLHRHCCIVLRDQALASDVTQTIFVEAHRDLDRFSGKSSLRSWLFGIARHRCLDALRSRRRAEGREVLGADPPDEADARPAPDIVLESRGALSALDQCLRELAPSTRIAVLLRFQEGMPYAEIARLSREPVGTLQARVCRALPVLEECLRGKGIEP